MISAFAECTQVRFSSNSSISPKVKKCDDGTITYSQPKSAHEISTLRTVISVITGNPTWGMTKSESYCGATAAANVHNAYCKNYFIEPLPIARKYFNDENPGVRYDTMVRGLNRFFDNQGNDCKKGSWQLIHPSNTFNFISVIYYHLRQKKSYWKNPKTKAAISPLIALINRTPETTSLHWVTIVGIKGFRPNDLFSQNSNSCIITLNEWGKQNRVSCKAFSKLASQVNSPFILRWMRDFNLIVFN